MKKIITFLLFLGLAQYSAKAQLADGSIAPNFELTDLEGHTWNLYDLLDQGKYVVIDFSATWCGPCWAYHQSGALENLYEQYGPDGTNEMMVFMIEGDEETNIDCLYNLPGCNSSTQGNWVAGTPYPIINDDFIAADYAISYWPTIYHICPNRVIREVNQLPTAEIYAMNGDCASAYGANNAGILSYTGRSGLFCQSATFAPSVLMQNLGTALLTSVTLELWINGNLQETLQYADSLTTYQIVEVAFSEVTLAEDAAIEIIIVNANGMDDEDPVNNAISADLALSLETTQNLLTIEVRTDGYPGETYWEMVDGNGNALYHGGNAQVVGGSNSSGAYSEAETVYTHNVPVPGDGCYEFKIYDSYGDGICCVEGNGYYKVKDPAGNTLFEGGSFEELESTPFSVSGSTTPILNNAAIVLYSGASGEFCGELTMDPAVTIQNLGINPITSAVVAITGPSGVISSYDWTGTLNSGEFAFISFGTITIQETPVTIELVSVNGETDLYDFQNVWDPALARTFTNDSELFLELQVDQYGYEIYWELRNSSGEVLYFGGNENVGPNGGGARIASPSDPGAYSNNEYVIELLTLPDDVNDCYEFLLVDDWGDGVVDGGGGYVRISNSNNVQVVDRNLDNEPFTELSINVDVQPVFSSVENLDAVSSLTLFPNPAQDEVKLSFHLTQHMPLQVEVFNAFGQQVRTVSSRDFPAGQNFLNVDVRDLANGFYYLKMTNGQQQLTRKFTVLNK